MAPAACGGRRPEVVVVEEVARAHVRTPRHRRHAARAAARFERHIAQ